MEETPDKENTDEKKETVGGNSDMNSSDTPAEEPINKVEIQALVSYTKFDFVPREQLLFYDNFDKDRIGEFPDQWLTIGMGQTVQLNAIEGNWLRLFNNSKYSPDIKFDLPENYTI